MNNNSYVTFFEFLNEDVLWLTFQMRNPEAVSFLANMNGQLTLSGFIVPFKKLTLRQIDGCNEFIRNSEYLLEIIKGVSAQLIFGKFKPMKLRKTCSSIFSIIELQNRNTVFEIK